MTTDQADRPAVARPAALRAVPVPRPGRWVAAAVLLLFAAMFGHLLLTNPNFKWGRVGHWLTWPLITHGALLTLELTFIAMVIGVAGGVLLAVMRLSGNPLAKAVAWLYIWFFRGTPVLVQFFFWFNISILVGRNVSFGVPFGPALATFDTNKLITAFTASIIALGLNEAAYMAEIVRAGISSVDEGQGEAARALGLTRAQELWRIVLPQAMKVVIPPTGNETISMLKTSSLASTIGLTELYEAANGLGLTHYSEIIALIVVASCWYLLFTTTLSIGQFYLERYYARGSQRSLPPTPFQKLMAANLSFRRRSYTAARPGLPHVPPEEGER